jgi:Glycosyl transferase 4-like domain
MIRPDTTMEAADSQSARRADRRLAVVSGYAARQLTPRGQRTQWLLRSLARDWETELFALPPQSPSGGSAAPGSGRAPWRRAGGDVVRTLLLDKWEPWSIRRLGRWRPRADAALLISYPWSPIAYAARRLQQAGVPYVVDAGDPWVLTSPGTDTRFLAKSRSSRAERAIFAGAAGAVLTTSQQAEKIAAISPGLPILVRPNGYDPLPAGSEPARPAPGERDSGRLRLVHYGMLTFIRVDVAGLLERLLASGRWKSISFTQYGDDHDGMLARAPAAVEIELRPPRPWGEVLADAHRYDLAVVVGNRLTGQLPSKAVQYMTLPIPRLGLSERPSDDALAEYVAGRPGWLALAKDDPDAAQRIWEHVGSDWGGGALAPPPEEAWPEVAARIGGFFERCVGAGALADAAAVDPAPVGGRPDA